MKPETLSQARERARTRIKRDKASISIYKDKSSPVGYYALSEEDILIDERFRKLVKVCDTRLDGDSLKLIKRVKV